MDSKHSEERKTFQFSIGENILVDFFQTDSVMEKILVKAQTIYFPCQCEKLGYLLIECWF